MQQPGTPKSPKQSARNQFQRNLVFLACALTTLFILLAQSNTLDGPSTSRILDTLQLANSSELATAILSSTSLSKLFSPEQWLLIEEETLTQQERDELHHHLHTLKTQARDRNALDEGTDDGAPFTDVIKIDQPENPGSNLPWDHWWDSRIDTEDEYDPEEFEIEDKPSLIKLPFIEKLKECTSLACLRKAHQRPRRKGQLNFPHALMVGWQDPAFDALFKHLRRNPFYLEKKNTEFFSRDCKSDPLYGCPLEKQKKYIEKTLRLPDYVDNAGTVCVVDNSPSYGAHGDVLAPSIKRALPWVRIVITLREPIGRAASMVLQKSKTVENACLNRPNETLYSCIKAELAINTRKESDTYQFITSPYGNYSHALQYWFESFGWEQVTLIQYEDFMARNWIVLRDLKKELGIGELLPSTKVTLDRPVRLTLTKTEYLKLIEHVKPDVKRVGELVEQYNVTTHGNGAEFITRWKLVWKMTLSTCSKDGSKCRISAYSTAD